MRDYIKTNPEKVAALKMIVSQIREKASI